jgi:hypothetical protein
MEFPYAGSVFRAPLQQAMLMPLFSGTGKLFGKR